MTRLIILAMLSAATPTAAQARFNATAQAGIGEPVRLGPLKVTPLTVVEDSRCPQMVTCVWRGRLRIIAAVGGANRVTLDDGVPLSVRGGQLTLVRATPLSQHGEKVGPRRYRFILRYQR